MGNPMFVFQLQIGFTIQIVMFPSILQWKHVCNLKRRQYFTDVMFQLTSEMGQWAVSVVCKTGNLILIIIWR